jgi:protein-tyrosine phosphatase
MAAGLLAVVAKERGIHVEARSAGLAHHPNAPVAVNAVTVMKDLGIDISSEYSKPVTPEAVRWADLIIGIERKHSEQLSEHYPSAIDKLKHLAECVHDPYCGPVEEYRRVRDELNMLLSRFDFGP